MDRRQSIVDEWLTQFDRTSEITDKDINTLLSQLWPGRKTTTGNFETREQLEDFVITMYSEVPKTSVRKVAEASGISPALVRIIVNGER